MINFIGGGAYSDRYRLQGQVKPTTIYAADDSFIKILGQSRLPNILAAQQAAGSRKCVIHSCVCEICKLHIVKQVVFDYMQFTNLRFLCKKDETQIIGKRRYDAVR